MMHEDLILCPFERSVEGPRGTVLLRKHRQHASRCADAIKRRKHPAWSSQKVEFRVSA